MQRVFSKSFFISITCVVFLFLFANITIVHAYINGSQIINTVAGNGTNGFSGDGGLATSANLSYPIDVATDTSGNVFILDAVNHRIRKVDTSGIITTYAGNGTAGFSGDGGPATSATFNNPQGIATDSSGNLYIADSSNHRIRRVGSAGIITTIAGTGNADFNGGTGDGGTATSAKLNAPQYIAVDSGGNIFINDTFNERIRKISSSGTITTYAGSGTTGFSGDDGLATSASFDGPAYLVIDPVGDLFIWDFFNKRIRKVDVLTGIITTVAGDGSSGYSGDEGAVSAAVFNNPTGFAADSSGNLYIDDASNYRIRKIIATLPPPPAPEDPDPAPIITRSRQLPLYAPEVKLIAPLGGETYINIVTINYTITDVNDTAGPSSSVLGDFPTSLFYSNDKGKTWILIEKNLSPQASYKWDVSGLLEAASYKIKITAIDMSGKQDEAVSGVFSIDRVFPLFEVSAEPRFSKGENVSITIWATEPLMQAPRVTVTQRNHVDVLIEMSGTGAVWKGEYEVDKKFDGTAKIRVLGTDMAGNTGNIISEGGFFNVGFLPPPPPIIFTPIDRDVVRVSRIDITGKIRRDVKAVLFIGNDRVQEVLPDRDGNFIMKDIVLSATTSKGMHTFKIQSEDQGGNLSREILIHIKFNIPPFVKILRPRPGDVVQGNTIVEFLAQDGNDDSLTFTFEVSSDGQKTWQEVSRGLLQTVTIWDTGLFAEGEYIMRVIASDGFDEAVATSSEFTVSNALPIISFKNNKTISGKNTVIIDDGFAQSVSRTIVDVEYSVDDGISWLGAKASDDDFDSGSENFFFTVKNMPEGVHNIRVRTRDSKSFVSEVKKILVIDFGPPPAPTVISPNAKEVFGLDQDLDEEKAGVQVRIRGRAEPSNDIIIENGTFEFVGRSNTQGIFDIEVTLRNHGENRVLLYAIDPAENRSEKNTLFTIVHNNPPDVEFLRPKAGGVISGKHEIAFLIQDPESDAIKKASLAYRHLPGRSETVLTDNINADTFLWDVSDLEDGFYELIITANDGVSERRGTREFLIDNTKPTIAFDLLKQSVFSKSFTLEMTGNAQDAFSGIKFVEYSIKAGEWFKALIVSGYLEREAIFRVSHPFELEDGIYEIRFRATDMAGNVFTMPDLQKIVIDTTPPRIGSYTLSIGSLLFFPAGDSFQIAKGATVKFILSLESDSASSSLIISPISSSTPLSIEIYNLSHSNGLWEVEFSLDEVGDYVIMVQAQDEVGNVTKIKKIGKIRITKNGVVSVLRNNIEEFVDDVMITVMVFSQDRQSWVRWQGEQYGLTNPIFSGNNGAYELLLPTGEYQVILQKDGFLRLRSNTFSLSGARFVTFDFRLILREGLRGFFEGVLERFLTLF